MLMSSSMFQRPSCAILIPYTTLFRSSLLGVDRDALGLALRALGLRQGDGQHAVLEACIDLAVLDLGAECDAPLELARSEEHTSELQSRLHVVCRLLLVKENDRLGVYL